MTTSYDLWLHPVSHTLQLVDAGLLTDLSHSIEMGDHDLHGKDFSQQLRMQLATYQGATVAVPLDGSGLLTLYRQDVLPALGLQVPTTWRELLKFAGEYVLAREQRLQRRLEQQQPSAQQQGQQQEQGLIGGSDVDPPYPLCLPLLGPGCSQQPLLTAVWSSIAQLRGWQQGLHFDAASMRPLLDTPAVREALRVLARLMAASAPPEAGDGCGMASMAFARGHCALTLASFVPQMRVFVELGTNATVPQESVRAAPLPGSDVVWPGDGGAGLVSCNPTLCPHGNSAAGAAAAPAPGEAGPDAAEQQQQQGAAFVNFAPLLPPSLLAAGVDSRSSAVVQMLSFSILAFLASPNRYDEAAGESPATPSGPAFAQQTNATELPGPTSPLVSLAPVRMSYLSNSRLDLWVQAGYDAGLVRTALPIMAAGSQHPNQATGLRMPGAEYYNQLLDGLLEPLRASLVADAGTAPQPVQPPPAPPPSHQQPAQRRLTEEAAAAAPASGDSGVVVDDGDGGAPTATGHISNCGLPTGISSVADGTGSGSSSGVGARHGLGAVHDPGAAGAHVERLRWALERRRRRLRAVEEALEAVLAQLPERQALLASHYGAQAYRDLYQASLSIAPPAPAAPPPTPSPYQPGFPPAPPAATSGGAGSTPQPSHELVKVVVVAVVVSVVGGALLVAAGAAAVLWLPEGYLKKLCRRVSRRLSRQLAPQAQYRRKPSDISVSQHPQVKAPEASSGTAILVTDIQSSTNLWEALPTEEMNAAVQLHHVCVRRLIVEHDGYESATEGDSFILAFKSVKQAVAFALELQALLLVQPWPESLLQEEVCMPLYTDLPEGFPFTHHSGEELGTAAAAIHASGAAVSPVPATTATAQSALGTSPRAATAAAGLVGALARSSAGGAQPSFMGHHLFHRGDSHGADSRPSLLTNTQPPTPSAFSGTGGHHALSSGIYRDRWPDPRVEAQLQLQREVSLFSGFSPLPSRTRAGGRHSEPLASYGQLSGVDTGEGEAARTSYSGGSGVGRRLSRAERGDPGHASAGGANGSGVGGRSRRYLLHALAAARLASKAGRVLAAAAAAIVPRRPRAVADSRSLSPGRWQEERERGRERYTGGGQPHSARSRSHSQSQSQSRSPSTSRQRLPPPQHPPPPQLPAAASTDPSGASGREYYARPSATLHPALPLRPPPLLLPPSALECEAGGGGGDGARTSTDPSDAHAISSDNGRRDGDDGRGDGDYGADGDGDGGISSVLGRPRRPAGAPLPSEPLPSICASGLAEVVGGAEAVLHRRSLSSNAVAAAAAEGSGEWRRRHSGPLPKQTTLSVELLSMATASVLEGGTGTGTEGDADAEAVAEAEAGERSVLLSARLAPPPLAQAPPLGKTLRQLLSGLRKPGFPLHEAQGRARRLLMFRGLRVRVGIHTGVSSEAEVVYNAASARVVFSGPCVATCKAVADLAHGGQIFLSDAARAALEAATHHHNGGRPAGTLMLRMATYALSQEPSPPSATPVGSALAGARLGSVWPGSGAILAPRRALSRAISSPTAGMQASASTCPLASPFATVDSPGGSGRRSLDLVAFRSVRARNSADMPTPLPPLQAAVQLHQQQQAQAAISSAYWLTCPSLSQRLALVPPPRGPPKGHRTVNDVYDMPVGRVSYAVVQVPAAAALLAWDDRVAREALALLAAEAAEQLREVDGGYLTSPQPGHLTAAFTSATAAVRWAEGLRQRLLDAPWSQGIEPELGPGAAVKQPDALTRKGTASAAHSALGAS
ncbi:hypothetical protein GPECTOR_40g564 [Gonium pectorale]|uniref:Guanylate cyclase domain-containing protein n=1 Tax=Gonium pectorale TaxID=33097 RepID=A0A150GBT8_GONPE|nr:hypothetical protein GPECTOR_40g564 [Gonium pectorale]|eukprot:KXZ46830.1 hypothetical protein GPECTOR_40g564 [Gonium pectorale]